MFLHQRALPSPHTDDGNQPGGLVKASSWGVVSQTNHRLRTGQSDVGARGRARGRCARVREHQPERRPGSSQLTASSSANIRMSKQPSFSPQAPCWEPPAAVVAPPQRSRSPPPSPAERHSSPCGSQTDFPPVTLLLSGTTAGIKHFLLLRSRTGMWLFSQQRPFRAAPHSAANTGDDVRVKRISKSLSSGSKEATQPRCH